MNLSSNTVLITGGSSGIGMALAERFIQNNNEVIITGRNEQALKKMKQRFPKIHTLVSDAGEAKDREQLAQNAVKNFPGLNILINNAGIQRKVNLTKLEPWSETAKEIEINLAAPIHLSELFIPFLSKQPNAHIMNVSSGLAFVPLAHMPVYCATKAALHSFTLSLRHQLRDSNISVTEIIPPAVKTNLGGSHDFGEELSEFADGVMRQLAEGKQEVTFGMSARSSQLSREQADHVFKEMNSRF